MNTKFFGSRSAHQAAHGAAVPVHGLVDACSECFTLILHLQQTEEFPEPAKLAQTAMSALQNMKNNSRSWGTSEDDISHAQYALAAFIDEILLNSNWSGKESWSGQTLTAQLFHDFNSGVNFFQRLESLRTMGTEKQNVAEIYLHCLLLGFEGEYKKDGIVHKVLIGCMRHQEAGLRIICDSSDGVYDKVEADMRSFLRSVTFK